MVNRSFVQKLRALGISYYEYLNSPEFRRAANQAKSRHGKCCYICRVKTGIAWQHTDDAIPYEDHLMTVVQLCDACMRDHSGDDGSLSYTHLDRSRKRRKAEDRAARETMNEHRRRGRRVRL